MSDKKKQKQNFLREEIMEKGYEGVHFAQYLDENRTDGKFLSNQS